MLYVLGSYAMTSLGSIRHAGNRLLGKLLFYLLVTPGVICHESGHYLACRLTGTRVGKFRPFAPSTDPSGRTTLGYVTHDATNPLTGAVIGMAPVVANPLLLVLLTSLLTPLEPLPTVSSVSRVGGVLDTIGALVEGALRFGSAEPVAFAVWAYLALSLAVGSVPSREDFSGVPAALLLLTIGGLAYASVAGADFMWGISQAAVYGIAVYLLPLLAAGVAGMVGVIVRG